MYDAHISHLTLLGIFNARHLLSISSIKSAHGLLLYVLTLKTTVFDTRGVTSSVCMMYYRGVSGVNNRVYC